VAYDLQHLSAPEGVPLSGERIRGMYITAEKLRQKDEFARRSMDRMLEQEKARHARVLQETNSVHAHGKLLPVLLKNPGAPGVAAIWHIVGHTPVHFSFLSTAPKRPLYGLERLAERPSAPVLVCEGEKASDASVSFLPGFVAIASPNGARSAGKADWSPLKGRRVVIWADAGAAGLKYANAVAERAVAAGAVSVAIAPPPPGVPSGWNAADALAEGWTAERAAQLAQSAQPFTAFLSTAQPENVNNRKLLSV
jgi:hypothetical protein